tara:strand:+ start:488 stop:979 length:492 start_codon:yes stop_codon:yes gene_type:complete
MDNELDTDWFDKQMNIEKHYDDFYNSCVKNVNATMIFINENNTVSCIKREIVAINNGILPRSKIVELVKKHRKINTTIYNLYAILQFNYDISPERVIQGKLGNGDEFFNIITHIQDVFFNKTIKVFNTLNELTLVMRPKNNNRNQTKRVYLTAKNKRRKTRKR